MYSPGFLFVNTAQSSPHTAERRTTLTNRHVQMRAIISRKTRVNKPFENVFYPLSNHEELDEGLRIGKAKSSETVESLGIPESAFDVGP